MSGLSIPMPKATVAATTGVCPERNERWTCVLAGVLACLDGYMNIAMEQTEEYVNGQLKAKYGDTFIRGNNGESLLAAAQ